MEKGIKRFFRQLGCEHDWSTPTGTEFFGGKERTFKMCKKEDCWKIKYLTKWKKWIPQRRNKR